MKRRIDKVIFVIFVIFVLAFVFYLLVVNRFSIFNSIRRSLFVEDRYMLLLGGLWQTLIISFLSIFIGSVLAGFICFLRMSKNKYIKYVGKFLISTFQGLPITVILLLFYYCVFGSVNINPVLVSIISFSLYFSVYVAEIYRGALDSINKTQIDSAYSLGLTKFQTIRYIIVPQMLSYIIPVYKNECVALIKLTSIVGFISVMDLTRASEIIRNRTYEAFFPLIFTAFIYYGICFVLSKFLDYFYKKINPRKGA